MDISLGCQDVMNEYRQLLAETDVQIDLLLKLQELMTERDKNLDFLRETCMSFSCNISLH